MKTVPYTITYKMSEVREVVNSGYTDLVDIFGYALYTLPSRFWDPYLSGSTKLSHFRNYGIVEPDCKINGDNGYINLQDPGMLRINPKTITMRVKIRAEVSVSQNQGDDPGSGSASVDLYLNGNSVGSVSASADVNSPSSHPGWDFQENTYTLTGLTYYSNLNWICDLTNGQQGYTDVTNSGYVTIISVTLTSGDTGTRIVPQYYGWSSYDNGSRHTEVS